MRENELKNIIEKDSESYLDRKYFYSSPYRKIKHQLILDIMTARLEELIELSYKKNTNISNLKSNGKIYFYIESSVYYKNIQYSFERSNLTDLTIIFNNSTEESLLSGVNGACELIGKGWEKEAIPIIQKKRSFISGFFSKLFS